MLAGANADVTDDAIRSLAARVGTRLMVTLGARGAALLQVDGTVARVPATRVAAVDTSGAGDAFVGAFAVGIAVGWQELDAVALGLACASDSVTRPGTQASFPDPVASASIVAGIARS
jgi:ribokinase